MNTTDALAIYGAIASTIGGAWQVFQHYNRGPKLSIYCADSMQIAGATGFDDDIFLIANVSNRGTETTTITHVTHVTYKTRLHAFLRYRKGSKIAVWLLGKPGNTVPYECKVGSTFIAMTKQTEELEQLTRSNVVYLEVVHTFSNRPARHRIRPIRLSADLIPKNTQR